MTTLNPVLDRVTERIRERSLKSRSRYEHQMRSAGDTGPHRSSVSCGNLAHAAAACSIDDKKRLASGDGPNIAIVTAYNDMLSAHQPLGAFPDIIKETLSELDATAQIAGGVPAMCDGVTQGMPGMDLSLFSRDVIAMATAVSLSHNVFDGALMLGVCDKIVPGLFIGAARFGHLPILFLPAGPMASGMSNDEKVRVRQEYAAGKIGRDELLAAESASYHSPGTCTFYGTANSNQMMMEIMGLHVPGSAFVNPGTPLRDAYVRETAHRVAHTTALGDDYIPFWKIIDERALINAIVGLHATGGSTNHTIHLVAMARAVGVQIDWNDLSDLSDITPTLSRIYPNGSADVNHFHAAGGLGFVIRELIDHGLLHEDVTTVMGKGLRAFAVEGALDDNNAGRVTYRPAPQEPGDETIVRPADDPVSPTGGLVLLDGNIGRCVIKISAVRADRRKISAPAILFKSQQDLIDRFKAGDLERDFMAILPFQGPKANGMPELHKLNPPLGVLQEKGYKIALITDGRMSGASGKIPAAIHLTPEALDNGPIARIQDGDMVHLDAENGILSVDVAPEVFAARKPLSASMANDRWGAGRELFAGMRHMVTGAEQGAMTFMLEEFNHEE